MASTGYCSIVPPALRRSIGYSWATPCSPVAQLRAHSGRTEHAEEVLVVPARRWTAAESEPDREQLVDGIVLESRQGRVDVAVGFGLGVRVRKIDELVARAPLHLS